MKTTIATILLAASLTIAQAQVFNEDSIKGAGLLVVAVANCGYEAKPVFWEAATLFYQHDRVRLEVAIEEAKQKYNRDGKAAYCAVVRALFKELII